MNRYNRELLKSRLSLLLLTAEFSPGDLALNLSKYTACSYQVAVKNIKKEEQNISRPL